MSLFYGYVCSVCKSYEQEQKHKALGVLQSVLLCQPLMELKRKVYPVT